MTEPASRVQTLAAGQETVEPVSPNCPPGVCIVGRSQGMELTLEYACRVGLSRCNPVLICGETGAGKELVARAVHIWRYGSLERFVAVNCASLTPTLMESELFGHVKGAFTGADRDKVGLFELAQDGSLFLDEISEVAPELQAKLLRVLQERTFRKVGGTKDTACNATVIASSNRRLLQDVEDGKFRRDLYYRLAVFPITIPPLRDPSRQGDIPLLARHFVASSELSAQGSRPSVSAAAIAKLMSHAWPGNVRELRNVMDRAVLLERTASIGPGSIVFDDQHTMASPQSQGPARQIEDFSLEAAEREFIMRALKEANWQRTRAASLLGITRATLHAKIKRYDLRPSAPLPPADREPQPQAARSEN